MGPIARRARVRGPAIGVAVVALVALALAVTFAGCCDPKGQFELVATVVDGPTGQLIPMPVFVGDAAYAKCQSYFGQMNGAGGSAQNKGPCFKWLVYANENGKSIIIGAEGYHSQTFDVPKGDPNACGLPDTSTKTFRLKRTGP
jgi:hypothetical protein